MMGEGPGFTQGSGKLFFLHSYKIIIPGRRKKGSMICKIEEPYSVLPGSSILILFSYNRRTGSAIELKYLKLFHRLVRCTYVTRDIIHVKSL